MARNVMLVIEGVANDEDKAVLDGHLAGRDFTAPPRELDSVCWSM